MSTTPEPRKEHPSTYFVQDRSSEAELARLQIQDQMFTASMGGVLPEQPDSLRLQRVLDVGCGTGDWLIKVAQEYPDIETLIGVDISGLMVQYARTQAEAQGVSGRVEFHVMDALRMLEFPNNFFDLVNQRLGDSYLRTWDWSKLLQEYQRVIRPDGVIRITEYDMLPASNSPAYTRFTQMFAQAFYQAGHLFTPQGNGEASQIVHLLNQCGLQQVQICAYALEYRAGTPQGQNWQENGKHFLRTIVPFLRKWGQMPDDYEILYQQALEEMRLPDFVTTLRLCTAWGTRHSKLKQPLSALGDR
jgi:ubiquinone/menaquinone biosynthesis C-methylase UbiE